MRKLGRATIVFLFVIAALIAVIVLFGTQPWQGKTDRITGKIGTAKLDRGAYHTIYVKRTSYENTYFTVYNDVPQKGGTYLVDYGLEDKAYNVPEYGLFDPYDLKYPVNTVTEQYMDSAQYKKHIDGYSSFRADLTLTTIILRKSDHGKHGYAYTYAEFGHPAPVHQDVQDFLDTIRSGKGLEETYKMNLEGEKLDQYIAVNKIGKI